MGDVSNKTIVALLAVALVVTVLGTVVSVSKLGELGGQFTVLTGADAANQSQQNGTSTLEIEGFLSITNQVDSIAFGTGFVNNTDKCTACDMDSDVGIQNATCCSAQYSNTTDGFLIENTGNVNASVNYTCSGSCTAADFIGGTGPAFQIKSTANSVALQNNESTAPTTDSTASCGGAFNATYEDVTLGGAFLCGNLSGNYPLHFDDDEDAFVVDLNVSIPADAPPGGTKTATFEFNAFAEG